MSELQAVLCRVITMVYQFLNVITTLFGIYFAVISCGILCRKRDTSPPKRQLRFAVVSPARNEASCIAALVESLQQQEYPAALVDIYVVVNNCTDNTADVAQAAGARILHASPAVQSKGAALQEAFAYLMKTGRYDAYCVFDADNEASPHFLAEMNRALQGKIRVAKSRILAKNATESWISACYEIYFCTANAFLNTARSRLGLSARLIGTGFAVRHDLMEELDGWNTSTLTEDAECYATLSARGEPIAFVPHAVTYDEEPLTFRASLTQRRRWMSGVMEVARKQGGELLWSILDGSGGIFAFDALMQLVFAWVQAAMIPLFLLWCAVEPHTAGQSLPLYFLQFYTGSLLTAAVALLWERRMTTHHIKALLCYPFFLFSFLPLQTLAMFCPNRVWKPIPHTGTRCTVR